MSRSSVSSIHNVPPTALADEYATLLAQLRGLEGRRDQLKAALIEQAGDAGEIIGTSFKITVSLSTRSNLDMDAARAKLATITTVRAVLVRGSGSPRRLAVWAAAAFPAGGRPSPSPA